MGDFRSFLEGTYADELSGSYEGGAERTSDFGTGWKLRLIPKTDGANYIIKRWLDKNRDMLRQYKLKWNAGDRHVWTVYVPSGSSGEARRLAALMSKELGPFIEKDKLYQSEDLIVPGTGISGRFDMRSENLPRQKEIADEIERLRPGHNPFPGLHKEFRNSPQYMTGFPNRTSGEAGVPGTAYHAWLKGKMGTEKKWGAEKSRLEMIKKEAEAEIRLVDRVLREKLGANYEMDR